MNLSHDLCLRGVCWCDTWSEKREMQNEIRSIEKPKFKVTGRE